MDTGFLGIEYDDLDDSFYFFKSKTKQQQQKLQHFELSQKQYQPWTRRDLRFILGSVRWIAFVQDHSAS